MKVKIIDQDAFGNGVAKEDKTPIFVNKALSTEEVEIEISMESKKFKRAIIKNIIKKSKDRVDSECSYYDECGGCQILHQKYSAQLEFKKSKVLNNLKRIGELENIEIKEIISGDNTSYRNKVTLHAYNGKLGFYKENTNHVIQITKCLLINPKLNEVINDLNKMDLKNISEIILKISEANNNIMVVLKYNKDIRNVINKLRENPLITSIIITQDNKYQTVYNDGFIKEKIGEYDFLIGPKSFFQVNNKVAKKAYELIDSYLVDKKKKTVLDLYCGIGSIGIYVAKNVKSVIGLEIEEESIKFANENKDLNKIKNIEFVLGKVEDNISKIKSADIVILDPPRSGCDTNTINTIIELKPSEIIYMSCDSATLSRDIKQLKEFYDVKEITLFDMFPNTYHVESVCLLTIK